MQAIHHDAVCQYLNLGDWLTSAWLADAQRSKTLLEKLLKPYNAGPFYHSFPIGNIVG